MASGRPGTGPFSKFKKGSDHKLLAARIHKHDAEQLESRLKSEGISFTAFMQATIAAYLAADPQLIRIVADWKRSQRVGGKAEASKMTFSRRERDRLAEMIMTGSEPEEK